MLNPFTFSVSNDEYTVSIDKSWYTISKFRRLASNLKKRIVMLSGVVFISYLISIFYFIKIKYLSK